jgi:hypothetical protein
MLPRQVVDNVINGGFANTEFLSEGFLTMRSSVVQLANFSNLTFRQFGLTGFLATCSSFRVREASVSSASCRSLGMSSESATPFFRHILTVVFGRSYEKMFWVRTWRIVATVTNEISFGYWPNMHLIRQAMGGNFSIQFLVINKPIAIWRCASKPRPTSIGLYNKLPKAFFDRRFAAAIATLIAAKSNGFTAGRKVSAALSALNFLRGIIGLHKNLLILLPKPRTLARRWALSIGQHLFNYNTSTRVLVDCTWPIYPDSRMMEMLNMAVLS